MQILSASEMLEKQNSLGTHSENADFKCQRDVRNTEFHWDPQRKRECSMPANKSKAMKYYRIPVENENSLCSQTAIKPENIIESPSKTRTRYARKQLES